MVVDERIDAGVDVLQAVADDDENQIPRLLQSKQFIAIIIKIKIFIEFIRLYGLQNIDLYRFGTLSAWLN